MTLRVAVVGAGPAGAYTTAALLNSTIPVEVTLLDRLPTPWGLIRSGVAPDHQDTKGIQKQFEKVACAPGVQLRLNVNVGLTVSHSDVLSFHHAVVYAVGSSGARSLNIPGEHLPGYATSSSFVGWYNGHPDHQAQTYDFSGRRAVIVGNGNVALDVARMLLASPDALARTDITDLALNSLSGSEIREVVILGRRGPSDAGFSSSEFRELMRRDDLDVVVESQDQPITSGGPSFAKTQKSQLIRDAMNRPSRGRSRRVVLRFLAEPARLVGSSQVETVVLKDGSHIDAGLVIGAIGYRGVPVSGLPFDDRAGVIPNNGGRVSGQPGTYVTGWIKRGPSGVIGTNKVCAAETVALLLGDYSKGELAPSCMPRQGFDDLLTLRSDEVVDLAGWRAIDRRETDAGVRAGRPRVKITSHGELVQASRRAVQ